MYKNSVTAYIAGEEGKREISRTPIEGAKSVLTSVGALMRCHVADTEEEAQQMIRDILDKGIEVKTVPEEDLYVYQGRK